MGQRVVRAATVLKDNPVVPILLSSLTALTALLAAFGGADAARRNNAAELKAAVILVLAALFVAGIAALVDQKPLVGLALLLLVLGLFFASLAALNHQAGRPTISASFKIKPSPMLDVSVKRDGLAANDQMEVLVEGRSYNPATRADAPTSPPSVLYRASFGPNEKGQVDLAFSIPVASKPSYDALLLKTWVPKLTKGEQALECGPQTLGVAKFEAACVLAILPAPLQ